jgi:mRNA interferase MazF
MRPRSESFEQAGRPGHGAASFLCVGRGRTVFARRAVSGRYVQRGEVWWVDLDERRPVVLLSGEEACGFGAMQIVAPAGVDISGLSVEVAVGAMEGMPFEGVLRFAFQRPGFTPWTWLTTVSRDDLIERAGVLSPAKLSEIEDALRLGDQEKEWTPATAAKLSQITSVSVDSSRRTRNGRLRRRGRSRPGVRPRCMGRTSGTI